MSQLEVSTFCPESIARDVMADPTRTAELLVQSFIVDPSNSFPDAIRGIVEHQGQACSADVLIQPPNFVERSIAKVLRREPRARIHYTVW